MKMRQFEVLQHNGFGLLALATLLSRFGDVIAGLGFIYLAYRLTGSQSATTGVALSEVLPYLLFGLMGGVLSDSVPKLKVMIGANWYRAFLEVLTVLLLLLGIMPIWLVLVLPFLIQLGGVLYNPCSRASVIHIVDEDRRVAANSVMSLIENITAIIAPFIASSILLFDGAIWAFFAIDAITFLVGGALLNKLGTYREASDLLLSHASPNETASVISRSVGRISLFWRGVGNSSVLVMVFVSTFLTVLCGTWAWQMGTLFVSVPQPEAETWFYASLLALYSIAGMATGLLLPVLTDNLQIWHYRIAVVIWSVGLITIGLAPNRLVVALGVAILGVGVSLASQSRAFLLQKNIPRWAIGQGFAAAAVLLYGADLLSLTLFGAVNVWFGLQQTVVLSSCLMFIGLVLATLIGRGITRYTRKNESYECKPSE